jgi:Ser/Thr protein kinase RdoA (MazF antagonist)
MQVEVNSEIAPFPAFGDFEAWSGIPINPAKLIQKLPLTKAEQESILAPLKETRFLAPSLYEHLPQQIIHRDYDESNILMEGNSVTGVLDFEFSGPDLRILDLAYALSSWPSGLWNTGNEWPMIDAFGQGYLGRQRLTLAELEALPLAFRLRATASLSFHLGRFAQGAETQEEILDRIQEQFITESWLQTHAEELVRHARSWLINS